MPSECSDNVLWRVLYGRMIAQGCKSNREQDKMRRICGLRRSTEFPLYAIIRRLVSDGCWIARSTSKQGQKKVPMHVWRACETTNSPAEQNPFFRWRTRDGNELNRRC